MYLQRTLINVPQDHHSRDWRLRQIVSILDRQGRGADLTLRQIAKLAGMSKSKHLADLVGELVEAGLVDWKWGQTHNGLSVRLFWAREE